MNMHLETANGADVQARHRRFVLTPWTTQGASAPVLVRGSGSYLYDIAGRRYFDLGSGLVAVNLGHGHPAVTAALSQQAQTLCYAAPSFYHDKRAELAEGLSAVSPWAGEEGCRTFFTTSGADANEDAVRMARAVTGRAKVLSAYRSFHGASGVALSLSGENRRWGGEPGAPSVSHFFAPYPYRSPFGATSESEEMERALNHLELVLMHEGPSRVAAVVLEPVVGSNGIIVYPKGYLSALRAITARHGIFLILDEVMTGFGRVGASFAANRFDVIPDMITFAKGVTSAYIPLGGVLVRESIAREFDTRPLPCGHTYSGHPLAVSVGLATLRAYQDERVFDRALQMEEWLREQLAQIAHDHRVVGDMRGVGAMFGLELVKDRTVSNEPLVAWHGDGAGVMKDVLVELLRRGVCAIARYNCLAIAPPLTASKAELVEALGVLDEVLSWLEGSGRLGRPAG